MMAPAAAAPLLFLFAVWGQSSAFFQAFSRGTSQSFSLNHQSKQHHLNMVQTEQTIADLGLELPPPPPPAANYIPVQRDGNLLYLSGHIPFLSDGKTLLTGKVGGADGKSVDDGYAAAKQVALNLLASLSRELGGDLDRVEQIVKLFGVVHSADDFYEQHKVMNGASDVFVSVFGKERGMHARSAIGVNALPLGVSVEIEAIVRVKAEE